MSCHHNHGSCHPQRINPSCRLPSPPPTSLLRNTFSPPSSPSPPSPPFSPSHPPAQPPATPTLDASAFPHIIDSIFAHAPHGALLVLRTASRAFHVQAETEFVRHLTLKPHHLRRQRGRLPSLPKWCDQLIATSDPTYFSTRYVSPPPLRVRHLVLILGCEALTSTHASLVPGRGGLDTSPEEVTVIFIAREGWLVRSRNQHRALMGRLGEWVGAGVSVRLVDAQVAWCRRLPCPGCEDLQKVKADITEAVVRNGGVGEAQFLSMAEYVERVGKDVFELYMNMT